MTGKGDTSTPSLELPRPANTEPAHPDDHDPRTPLMDTITATPLDHHDTPLTAHLSEQPHNTASTQPSEPRTIPSVKRVSKPVGFKDLDDGELKAPTPLKFSSNQQTPEDFDIFTNDDDSRSVDTFGLPAYVQRYLVERGTDVPEGLSVPWNLRDGDRQQKCTTFDCLRSANFWKQFEFSMRMTVIAVLVLSSIIAARVHNTPFISVYASISSTVLAAKTSVGESIAYIFTWARAGCCWLPLACIAGATRMSNNMVAWSLYYTIILFFMATYTEAMVRRICLLLFNSCMVGLLMFPTYGAVYPCRVMVDWCIGTGLCFLAILIPYPIFCFKAAQRSIDDIAKNTGTAFRGLVYSFWSPTNVERNMAMTKVRHMTESLDHLLPELEHSQSFSFYEFLFEPTEHREVRRLKQAFFERLRVNLSSMTRVLDMVEANPGAIDDSDRSKAFGLSLTPLLDDVASSFDDLLLCLSQAKTLEAIGALQKKFDAFKDRTDTLRMMYKSSRKRLFYEHASDTLEEFVPLMTFYIFTVECFYDTLEVFELDLKTYSKSPTRWSSVLPVVKRVVVQPFLDNVEFTRVLVTEWDRREVQRVIEAAKVSGAMILTIGFSFLIKIDKASFSGPNIIAFVAGSNPVEAVQASIVRLTGCLIGTVLGFFAGTYSNTPVQRVASLCTLMFIGTFLRNDKEYGIMAIYAMFVLIPLDTIMGVTLTTAVERMNQNTFGIFIYLLVSILIFPLSPATILRAKRRNVLKHMSDVVSRLMNLFSTPLASGIVQDGVDAKSHPILSNRSMHSVLHTDSAMEDLGRSLEEVTRRLKGTKEFMGFAKEERGLVEIDYPVKSCEQTYTHMHRMTVLLKTMEMSWNVIRSQSVYYKETQRMMQSLLPIAFDVSRSFARFVDLITYMMDDPATNLESDIMSTVLDLISASHELHSRKTQIMLMVINRALTNYRPQSKSTSADDGAAAHGSPDSSSPHQSQLKYRHTSAETIPNTYLPHRGSGYSQPLDLNFHENNVYLRHESQPHMSEHSGFRVSQSKRNVSVLPYLRHRGCVSTDECGESMPLKLPEDFELPVSSEDAEGFHSFTLCMDMFAEETKQLMMSLGIMLAQLRSKM